MATRQTPGKSGSRGKSGARGTTGASAQARKPASGGAGARSASGGGTSKGAAARNAAATRNGKGASSSNATPAAPAKGATVAGAKGGKGAPPATPEQSSARARIAGAWRAAVEWCGGGLPFATIVVSLLGLADSIYLTIEHFSASKTFACPENATINCLKVTTSAWSWLPAGPLKWSIPVSVAGLLFYVLMVVINSRWGWRAPWPVVHWVRLVSVVVGMVLVLYLVWAELFRINAICLFCTGVHVLTFLLFAMVVGRAAFSGVRAISD
jgi:uncharacterized membrane protein